MDHQISDTINDRTDLSASRAKIATLVGERAEALAQAQANECKTVDILPPQKFVLPEGDAAQILERQLACSAAMIGEIARCLVEESHPVAVYADLMKSTSVLIGASALAARVAGELRDRGATPPKTNVTRPHDPQHVA
ncbi:MAG: hypothetical protein ACTHPD_09995 [Rhizomicrobium sp.]